MVLLAACSTLLLAVVAPQDPPQPLLTSSESKSLRDKLGKMLEEQVAYDEATGRAREKAARDFEKAKEAWEKEWATRCEKKGDLLKSVVDLRAIFEGAFVYERRSGTSVLKKETPKDLPAYNVFVPRSYKNETPMRTVLLVPGLDAKNNRWFDARSTFAGTWENSGADKDTLFHIPDVSADLIGVLDRYPDYSKTGEDQKEVERIMQLLATFGETKRSLNIDRGRVVLDCGRDTSGFGLRLACHFPDLFAGVILRWPVEAAETRLGSITGLPVLMISSQDTVQATDKLKQRLEAQQEGCTTVLTATDEYPFKAAQPEIEKWLATVERKVMRKKVVLEPNDDRFRTGFWVGINRMDQVATAPADARPRLEVSADRANNRIDVKAVGIESFNLMLNDVLVDLDKPVAIVVNGKAVQEQRGRDFAQLLQIVLRKFDPDFLFPVSFDVNVPKDEKPAGDGSTGGTPATGGTPGGTPGGK